MASPELASIDGKIGPSAEATIAVTDEGLIRGDGVFEVIRLYKGKPFALGDHYDRIERSAKAIELSVERAPLEAEVTALLAEYGEHEGQLRIVITRGGRRILLTEQLPARGETISLAAVTYAPSVILTGVKSLSYCANMEATRLAKAAGADEAVLVRPDGVVLEAPTSALFWAFEDGHLHTPAIDTGILESITRQRIIDELHVEEGDFSKDDLAGANEAFLASTTREVQPVKSIDGRELPHAPGPKTQEAIDSFAGTLKREL